MVIQRGPYMHLQLELLLEPPPPRYSDSLPYLTYLYADLPFEDRPYLRLLAATLRSAIDDIRIAAAREAIALASAIGTSEEPDDADLAERARVTGAIADDALEDRNLAIAWLNGAEAPLTFESLCAGLGEWPHRMREAIARETGLTSSGPLEILDTTEVV